ncbi:hypothetical protein GCM10011376_21950 [Nocardioides flavus (ex Wang et al. 2016)]|uniref:MOSC domain-containing protein n=1 Tax=Nocardioides flavus (ex Wang et al. 2016) TaxID=2058780 RepID=A0ABQ3HIW2_9ACTN|nr:hypothetical protein GCM10011376_21950 [Nocardioides flavus (ex Wang et al. 2016)]
MDLLDGHAHLADLVVGVDLHGGTRRELVEAVCERLSVRGHGQLTAHPYAGPEAAALAGLGFAEVPADEPLPGPLASRRDETGRVLVRRVLRSHRSADELTTLLPVLDASPREVGTLRAVVRRPAPGEREVLEVGHLDVDEGLVGDTWSQRGSRRTPDGSAHPDMQLNLMNHRLVEFLAQDPARERLAGDQMFVDLDLSHEHLPEWSELHIGGPDGAVIVVTDQPHSGCGKFIARFGKDAMAFVNGPEGKPRRLRGLCARVVRPGPVRPGDEVRVVRPGAARPE